jgi:Tetracyclin repressor-like, C-terminal domain
MCAALREPGPMAPSRVAETLASSLVADPPFCDLLANLHLHPEHEVDLDRVVGIRRTIPAAVMSLADAIEQALPAPGRSCHSAEANRERPVEEPEIMTDAPDVACAHDN